MPRYRTVKPDLWADEDLSDEHFEVHVFAAAMLPYVDDEGWFRWHPESLAVMVFPYRRLELPPAEILDRLEALGYLRRYTGTDGREYGHVCKFLWHQYIDKPGESKILKKIPKGQHPPRPKKKRGRPGRAKAEYFGDNSRNTPRLVPEESLPREEGSGVERNREEIGNSNPQAPAVVAPVILDLVREVLGEDCLDPAQEAVSLKAGRHPWAWVEFALLRSRGKDMPIRYASKILSSMTTGPTPQELKEARQTRTKGQPSKEAQEKYPEIEAPKGDTIEF